MMRGIGRLGAQREADPEALGLIRQMVEMRKPIGAVSLAGALISTALGLPLDEDPFSIAASEIRIDAQRGIVWTPGHLASSRVSEIAQGIEKMVGEVLKRAAHGLAVLP